MAVRDIVKTGAYYALGAAVRARAVVDREPYLSGAFPTLELAQASLPEETRSGYDSDEMPKVALEMTLGILGWDYPILYWLDKPLREQVT